jgi:hypothetical protein
MQCRTCGLTIGLGCFDPEGCAYKARKESAMNWARDERRKQIEARTDRAVPCRCDAWYCVRRPVIITETFDFLCSEHAALADQ